MCCLFFLNKRRVDSTGINFASTYVLTIEKNIFFVTKLFMPPYRKIGGILFNRRPSVRLSVCPSVRPSVRPSVCLHKLIMNLVTRLIFGMKVHLIDTHLPVPRSRSSAKVKVKYQGHVSQRWVFRGH